MIANNTIKNAKYEHKQSVTSQELEFMALEFY